MFHSHRVKREMLLSTKAILFVYEKDISLSMIWHRFRFLASYDVSLCRNQQSRHCAYIR